MNIPQFIISCFFVSFISYLNAQSPVLFAEDKESFTRPVHGQICKAFADVNGDYRPDIIGIDKKKNLIVQLNSNEGEKFISQSYTMGNSVPWTIGVADIDNDGLNNILSSGAYDGFITWSPPEANMAFVMESGGNEDFFAQGSNFVDINNDGWIDLFICNDDGLSALYLNDGSGSFIRNEDLIDMRTAEPSDNSGNYASEWTDIDNDGDLDLYIAKCRIGINDPQDPRRINALFINEGTHFREAAREYGIDIGAQSWTANFGDLDNDGDMDLFVANHMDRSMIFENRGSSGFVEIDYSNSGGIIMTEAYQSAIHDLNNDGLQDILISGADNIILVNKGDMQFDRLVNNIGFEKFISFALADANLDGYTDIYASYNALGAQPVEKDKLWLNLSGFSQNHFLSLYLKGIESNANGIGATVEIYGDWGVQSRILQSGTGYTVTNDLSLHFGLGQSSSIDSLVIKWPSGVEDHYDKLESDHFYLAIENSCCEILPGIHANETTLDCINTEIELSSKNGIPLDWSNAMQGTSITTDLPGFIAATGSFDQGCRLPAQYIYIDTLGPPDKPVVDTKGRAVLCEQNVLEISGRTDKEMFWSNGESSRSILLDASGLYFAIDSNLCYKTYSDTLFFELIDPQLFSEQKDTLLEGPGDLYLGIEGENPEWYSDSEATDTISLENNFYAGYVDRDTVFYFSRSIKQQSPELITGHSIDALFSAGNYLDLGVDNSSFFTVEQDLVLKSVDIRAAFEGARVFHIIDRSDNTLIHSDTIHCITGLNTIEFNLRLKKGSYLLSTDESYNTSNYNRLNPGFFTLEEDLGFSYTYKDFLEITRNLLGAPYFTYYADWRFEPIIETCRTGISSYHVNVLASNVNEQNQYLLSIYPQPFHDYINFSETLDSAIIKVTDGTGARVFEVKNYSGLTLDLSFLENGIYILSIEEPSNFHTFKIIKF